MTARADADGFSLDDVIELTGVSRETADRLAAYVDVLDHWRVRHNLIGPEERARLWRRHVFDSLQLVGFVSPTARRLVDFGSGAGFPGLILACALMDRPGFEAALVESNGKKASFLRAAVREVGAPVRVLNARIADVSRETFDHVTARALAPLPRLFEHVTDFLSKEASALLLKGRDLNVELDAARAEWTFESEVHPSRSDGAGHILIVRALERRGE